MLMITLHLTSALICIDCDMLLTFIVMSDRKLERLAEWLPSLTFNYTHFISVVLGRDFHGKITGNSNSLS